MELGIIILFVSSLYYWLDSIRAKETATKHAKNACKKILLEFLDDTVLIKRYVYVGILKVIYQYIVNMSLNFQVQVSFVIRDRYGFWGNI